MHEHRHNGDGRMSPEQVQLAFDYVLAVDAGDEVTVELLEARIAGILAALARDIIFPVTALPENADDLRPADFVLDELGVLLFMVLHTWSHRCPASAAPAIAKCIIHFTARIFTNEPAQATRALEELRDQHLTWAHAAQDPNKTHR